MSYIIRTNPFRRTTCIFALVTSVVVTAGCAMEAGASFPGIAVESYPPDGYIATTEPVYYEGRATYWYGGNWYYRDGNRWNHYDREPPALQQRRVQAAPMRRSYGPAATRPMANDARRPHERARRER